MTSLADSLLTLDWPRPLLGRVALVTGGSRGIGLHVAWGLAAAGARVAICARNGNVCKEVADEIDRTGGEALAVTGNVGHPDDAERILADVVARWGQLDVLVNNAGATADFAPIVQASPRQLERTFEVNLHGPLRLVRAALEAGTLTGGSVVNIVSSVAFKGEPGLGVYAASKAAMLHATRTMARELGPQGIRVNAVAPGVIRTEFSRMLTETPAIADKVIAGTALGRLGEPQDVVGAVVWLASDAAAYVTGTVVVVDGGVLA